MQMSEVAMTYDLDLTEFIVESHSPAKTLAKRLINFGVTSATLNSEVFNYLKKTSTDCLAFIELDELVVEYENALFFTFYKGVN